MMMTLRPDGPIGSPFRGLLATNVVLTAALGLVDTPSLTRLIAMSGNSTSDAVSTAQFLSMLFCAGWIVTQCFVTAARLAKWAFLPYHILCINYLILSAITHDMTISYPLTMSYLAMAGWCLFGSVAAKEVRI